MQVRRKQITEWGHEKKERLKENPKLKTNMEIQWKI